MPDVSVIILPPKLKIFEEFGDSFGSEPLKCYLKSIFFLGIAIRNIYSALFSVRNKIYIDNNLRLSGDFRQVLCTGLL